MPKTLAPHQFLRKNPKRLAVVDQSGCTGCAGSPACVTFCETVTVKKQVVDAIRMVKSDEGPFEVAYIELDKCIGCSLCAEVCPWETIHMFFHKEGLLKDGEFTEKTPEGVNRPFDEAPPDPEREPEPVPAAT
ncbi:MAG: 4Fe-4S dicluster domain-containing protein [Acidobacteriota bacterium]